MLPLILCILGIFYFIRKGKIKALQPSQFPHIPEDEFLQWKSFEIKSIVLFLWGTWGVQAILLPVSLLLSTAMNGSESLPIVGGFLLMGGLVAFLVFLTLSAVAGNNAAKLKRQYSIVIPK